MQQRSVFSMTVEGLLLCSLLVLFSLAGPATAHAGSYTGHGETRFAYTNKAACCEDAVSLAQEASARACERAGGYAVFPRGSARGRCDWDAQRTRDGMLYGCTATASVNCR
jgi:hypothetical protein